MGSSGYLRLGFLASVILTNLFPFATSFCATERENQGSLIGRGLYESLILPVPRGIVRRFQEHVVISVHIHVIACGEGIQQGNIAYSMYLENQVRMPFSNVDVALLIIQWNHLHREFHKVGFTLIRSSDTKIINTAWCKVSPGEKDVHRHKYPMFKTRKGSLSDLNIWIVTIEGATQGWANRPFDPV